jgi:uncharacterized NAD(P)/FAD-binding protein YdhS
MNCASELEHHDRPRIVIIGGGFSGSMLAVHLARSSRERVLVTLIERSAIPGRGVAYATRCDGHLLNVRARDMSAYPESPDHFVKWAQQNHSSSVKPCDFLPRPLYGRYIVSEFCEAVRSHPDQIRCIQGEAISLTPADDATEIGLRSGQTVIADKVVLALGHFPPVDLALPGRQSTDSRFIPNPWAENLLADSSRLDSVLLVGSGLTSVDVTIEMRARGFEGVIHILSRRGLLPQTHKIVTPLPMEWSDGCPRTARGLLRFVRERIKTAEQQGSDWRAVIDSLRPFNQRIWRSLPVQEQKRFLRHVRAYWDVHRHRIDGRIGDQLARQLRRGQIRAHAGRITECREDDSGVHVVYRDRKNGLINRFHVDCVINCTGPESDYRKVGSRLLTDLFQKGLSRPDQLSLGLDVADNGALLDAHGEPSNSLYTLGPLRKGHLWESIAVPELRVQVADMAKLLLSGYSSFNAPVAESSLAENALAPDVATRGEQTCTSSSSTLAV